MTLHLYKTNKIPNTNNHQSFSPFYTNDGLVINAKWFKELDEQTRTDLEKFLEGKQYILEEKYKIPDNYVYSKQDFELYRFWYNNFSYEKWFVPKGSSRLPKAILIKIEEKHKILLREITKTRILSDQDLTDEEYESLKGIFTVEIDNSKEYFLRLSCCSYKHDFPITPLAGIRQFLDVMTRSRTFYRNEYSRDRETYVVLVPFVEIPKKHEFRLFIHNKKLCGASSQHCYDKFEWSTTELEAIATAIETFPLDCVRYNSFVADVWYSNGNLQLIECNPFGAFSSSGSALFDWVNDLEVLHGEKPPEFRYA